MLGTMNELIIAERRINELEENCSELFGVITRIAAMFGMPDSEPEICRKTIEAVEQDINENARYMGMLARITEGYDMLVNADNPLKAGAMREFLDHEISQARRVLEASNEQ